MSIDGELIYLTYKCIERHIGIYTSMSGKENGMTGSKCKSNNVNEYIGLLCSVVLWSVCGRQQAAGKSCYRTSSHFISQMNQTSEPTILRLTRRIFTSLRRCNVCSIVASAVPSPVRPLTFHFSSSFCFRLTHCVCDQLRFVVNLIAE